MNKDFFDKLFKLHIRQPWLADRQDRISAMWDELDNEEQADLVVELLSNFKYLSSSCESDAVSSIADRIVGLGVDPSIIQVVSLSADDDADSGQAVLYGLKGILADRGFSDVRLVNRFGRAQRYVEERRHVILIDEFVGTGRTLVGRVESMKRDFASNKKITDAVFYFYGYAGMSAAIEMLRQTGFFSDLMLVHSLSKGISEILSGGQDVVDLMLGIEEKIKPDEGGFPSLGDGGCQALYGRQGGNCPNSVFPFFWWPRYKSGSVRKTILPRMI